MNPQVMFGVARLRSDGLHKGALHISLVVYARYRNLVSREDHVAALNITPDVYSTYQESGVQLHWELGVPKGDYWSWTDV